MRFLIDSSPAGVVKKNKSHLVMGQLLTPLTGYSDWGGVYAIDNGAFSGFPEKSFKRLLERQKNRIDDCLFVSVPDIVGGGQRTLELFKQRERWVPDGWRIALVAQDGMEDLEIPWNEFSTIFIGGQNPWKDSRAAADIVRTAKTLNKWVHVGRVNTPRRYRLFSELGADSCDGSGVVKYDWMLKKIEDEIQSVDDPTLFDLKEKTDETAND